jgi:DNA polymerase-1
MEQIPRDIVQQAFDARQQAYPVLRNWLQSVRDLAATGALLDNGFGRLMRPDPDRAATQGPALIGQGAARDIVTTSLLRLVERDRRALDHLRGFVHDEVILSVPVDETAYWSEVLEDAFTWTWKDVPILCEVGKPSLRWSDCK